MNSITKSFIRELSQSLPDRKSPKVGRKPIDKEAILYELFKLFRYNHGWRNVKHKTICFNYLKEIQRRGLLQKFFNQITEHLTKTRPPETIIDSSDIVSFKVKPQVKYSGKYHNYCIKITVEVTKELIPITWSLDAGSKSDSKVFDKLLQKQRKLPYVMHLDKGYEKYERRRELKKKNCQVRMEMKKGKNKKRGPRFKQTAEEKEMRGSIEKFYGWLKSFMSVRLNRFRKKTMITASFLFALNYYTFLRLN